MQIPKEQLEHFEKYYNELILTLANELAWDRKQILSTCKKRGVSKKEFCNNEFFEELAMGAFLAIVKERVEIYEATNMLLKEAKDILNNE